ncbi:MAG: hypothetical protein IKT65_03415 [Clostridia bacterium]|nr:hypothetical protein [Clostridia bacterium]
MKKAFISTVSLALVFSMALSFASCDGDDDATKENTSTTTEATQTNAPQATEKQTEKATDRQTDTPDESEPTEDTATNAAITDAPVTDAPITNSPATTPETKAPAKDTTKMPETEAPVEDTTQVPETSAPEEETKAPEATRHTLTIPPEDPSIDYSQWGKYGFEKMLPEPLPYSDQEADWHNARFDYAPNVYVIGSMNKMYSTDEERKACYEILDEYANSLKKYGYDLYKTSRFWELTDDFNNMIAISLDDNDNNRIYVEIILATV